MEMIIMLVSILMSGVAIAIAFNSSKVKIENGTVRKENLVFKRDVVIMSNRLEEVVNNNKDLWSMYAKQNERIAILEQENQEFKDDIFILNESMLILKRENKDLKRRLDTIEQVAKYSNIEKPFLARVK